MRPLRAWLVTTHSGGSGQRKQVYAVYAMQTAMPGGTRTALQGACWTGRRKCWFPEARPGAAAEETPPEMPRWSAERRAGQRYWPVIPGDPGIGPTARRVTGCGVPHPAPVGALPPLGSGSEKGDYGVPGASQKIRAAEHWLFFIPPLHQGVHARLRRAMGRVASAASRVGKCRNGYLS